MIGVMEHHLSHDRWFGFREHACYTSRMIESATRPSSIHLAQVEVAYGQREPAVSGLNLVCHQGELVALIGPSGCGKSTILRLVAGLQQPTAGTVRCGDGDTGDDHRVGFVFQSPNLLPWRTVLDNIALPLELRGHAVADRHAAAQQAREIVGLSIDDETKLPKMLSGGMQMRVSVARALITKPDVMLMDEPFAAVDSLLRMRLNEDLLSLWNQQRWTTLFVTHNIDEAVFLAQRVLIMTAEPGRIAEQVDVPFSYPRRQQLRTSVEFHQLVDRVAGILRSRIDSRVEPPL